MPPSGKLNAVPGEAGYGTSAATYQSGQGYDLATGLGSVNVTNLIDQWSTVTFSPTQGRACARQYVLHSPDISGGNTSEPGDLSPCINWLSYSIFEPFASVPGLLVHERLLLKIRLHIKRQFYPNEVGQAAN